MPQDYGNFESGSLRPIRLWTFQRNNPERQGNNRWWVGNLRSEVSQEDHRKNLEEICALLNDLEETTANQRAKLQEVEEKLKSLSEDLKSFSTFEQICNSGMLRNFKIDSESDFARTILNLLQQTMELQISHLNSGRLPHQTRRFDETAQSADGVSDSRDQGSENPDGLLPSMEGPT